MHSSAFSGNLYLIEVDHKSNSNYYAMICHEYSYAIEIESQLDISQLNASGKQNKTNATHIHCRYISGLVIDNMRTRNAQW